MSAFAQVEETFKAHPGLMLGVGAALVVLMLVAKRGKPVYSNDIPPNTAALLAQQSSNATQLNMMGIAQTTQLELAKIAAPIALQQINEKALESNNAVAMSNNWDKLNANMTNAMLAAQQQNNLMSNIFGLVGLAGLNGGFRSLFGGGGGAAAGSGAAAGAGMDLGAIEASYGADAAGFAMAAGA